MVDRNLFLFLLLCVIWGVTWLAAKVGVDAAPPLLFAGSRFFVAGVVLAAALALRRQPLLPRKADWPRLMAASLLIMTASYALMFWGLQFVASGLAGVIEMSLTPVALLGFALLLGDERFDARRAAAIGLGVGGVLILLLPSARISAGPNTLVGCLAVSAAAAVYSLGAVLSRPLMVRYSSLYISAFTMVVGGGLLLLMAFAVEPGALASLRGGWPPRVIAAWLFLVVCGSLIAYTIYMRLLRAWGSSRSGSYAFLSSIVAVVTGVVVLKERLTALNLVGMVVLLVAAWFALRPSRSNDEASA